MSKIFVIGLPRTGTTSISVALLEMGYKVAHTAFSKHSFEIADAVTDCPCFSDFQQLDLLFPGSKFIYLERNLDSWLPSIQRLLTKMQPHLLPKVGHFNPVLKRSFEDTFNVSSPNFLNEDHLIACYIKHQQTVSDYFNNRFDLISIDISKQGSMQSLCEFLGKDFNEESIFPHLNKGEMVSNWKSYKHTNKINSLSSGTEHRKFFDYHE